MWLTRVLGASHVWQGGLFAIGRTIVLKLYARRVPRTGCCIVHYADQAILPILLADLLSIPLLWGLLSELLTCNFHVLAASLACLCTEPGAWTHPPYTCAERLRRLTWLHF